MQSSLEEQDETDTYSVPYNLQLITSILVEDTEHIVCIYPRFWPEKKYLHYSSSLDLSSTGSYEIHCLPQHSIVELPKALISSLGEEEINISSIEQKSFREKQRAEKVKVDEKELEHIMRGVYELGLLKKISKKEDRLDSFETSSSGTNYFLFEQFLSSIEPLIRELRRTYSQRIEQVSTLRGRLTNRGMVNLVARPSNQFECTFDEFIVQAPIYRIVSTCFDVILSSSFQSRYFWLEEHFSEFRSKSRRMKRLLSEMDSYSVPIAIKELEQFMKRTPRLFRKFTTLSPLMMSILRKELSALSENSSLETKYIFKAYTNLLWEDFLYIVLSEYFKDVEKQEAYPSAWDDVGGDKEVDFSVENGKELFDAKYMLGKSTFSSTYQHQMFFYLMAEISSKHLDQQDPATSTSLPIGPERISLVYPIEIDAEESESTTQHRPNKAITGVLNVLNANNTVLRRIGLPFPDSKYIDEMRRMGTSQWVKAFVKKYSDSYSILRSEIDD